MRTQQRVWILQAGVPVYLSLTVREWLGRHAPGRWIGRGPEAPVSWPPQSADLNPLRLLLTGFHENAVYANIVDTREQLCQRV